MTRFCPSCGTEVDESALFCPSCGQPIVATGEAEPASAPASPQPHASAAQTEAHPRAAASEGTGRPAPAAQPPPSGVPPPSQLNVPVTWPATLSGWLIGVGVAVAALGALIGFFDPFFNPIDVLLLPAFLAIAATVFFAASVPKVPHLALVTMAVALIGFGAGVDRIGFGGAGLGDLLLFLGTAAATIGALVLELGHDQPLGGRGT